MINLEDFAEEYDAARAEAEQYIHRAEKGIPSDRWLDGRVGAVRLAQANKTLLRMIDLQAQVMASMYQDAIQRGSEAMEASLDPMRRD